MPTLHHTERIIEAMRGWDEVYVFGLKSPTLDALFRKYRTRAGLSGFTFHDTRHTAATRLAGRVDVLTLCKIFGWSRCGGNWPVKRDREKLFGAVVLSLGFIADNRSDDTKNRHAHQSNADSPVCAD